MPTDVETLMEMGFSEARAQRALAKTSYKSVQVAMDWLFAHEGDADIDEPFEMPKGNVLGTVEDDTVASGNSEDKQGDGAKKAQAKSIKCDECGKLLKSEIDAQAHAARTQHSSFSESVEEIKALTVEEKKKKMDDLQDRLKQRRVEKDDQDKKEQIAIEKSRRTKHKENVKIKQKMEEDEMKKIAAQKRREKVEEKIARQRVKEQIEQDKIDRAAKFGKVSANQNVSTQPQAASASPSATSAKSAPVKEYDTCRLQIRLSNGSALTQMFQAKETLAAVRLFIEMNRTDGDSPFSLMTSFPRKVFTSEDMEKPLSVLDLVPSAVLIVTKTQ